MLHFFVLLTFLCSASALFNPYPRYKAYDDGGDPGQAVYVTDLINKGRFEEAQSLSKVTHDGLNKITTSYSGYFTVDKHCNSNMFFWYFPAKSDPKNAPVALWLQGGPGASSLFGLFTENGPFILKSNKTIKARPYSWHINHHLIYIDNPVGTGFSFTNKDTDKDGICYSTDETQVGQNLYEAVSQFFKLFPNLAQNRFYITGESYAGKYVPALGHTILKRNQLEQSDATKINLVGLAIGNGLSDPVHQMNYGDYLYQLGLIDLNGRELFQEYQKKGIDCIHKNDYLCAFNVFDELIDMDNTPYGSLFKNLTGFNSYFNYYDPKSTRAEDQALGEFLQASETRHGIHVGNNSFHDVGENLVENYLKLDIMKSVSEWVAELLSHYKVVIYNGQLDVIVAYPLTEAYLQKLKFSGSDDYAKAKRIIWKVDGQIAGYAKHAGNLTDVLVRNAGHMVPGDQPKWALDLILRLTMNKGFHG